MLFCLSLLATPLHQLSSVGWGGNQTRSNWKTGQAVYAVLASEGENVLYRALMMTGGMPTNPVAEGQSGGHTDALYPAVITHILNTVSKAPQFSSTRVGTS